MGAHARFRDIVFSNPATDICPCKMSPATTFASLPTSSSCGMGGVETVPIMTNVCSKTLLRICNARAYIGRERGIMIWGSYCETYNFFDLTRLRSSLACSPRSVTPYTNVRPRPLRLDERPGDPTNSRIRHGQIMHIQAAFQFFSCFTCTFYTCKTHF